MVSSLNVKTGGEPRRSHVGEILRKDASVIRNHFCNRLDKTLKIVAIKWFSCGSTHAMQGAKESQQWRPTLDRLHL